MKSPLDAKKLQELAGNVARDAKIYNDTKLPKAKDDAWVKLTYDSLPKMEKYLSEFWQDADPVSNGWVGRDGCP